MQNFRRPQIFRWKLFGETISKRQKTLKQSQIVLADQKHYCRTTVVKYSSEVNKKLVETKLFPSISDPQTFHFFDRDLAITLARKMDKN